MGRVEGKVALLTGAASGIGKAAAIMLAKEGAKVVIGDYNEAGAKETAEEIRAFGGEAEGIFLDASQEESIKDAVEHTVNRFGTIHILHNHVGLTNLKKDLDVVNIDLEEWDRLMNVNAKSVLLGSRFAIPYMKEANGGSIINTASIGAIDGDSTRTTYGASKAAVVNMTKYIATQYGKDNIRCNAVAPGLILTPSAENNMPEEVRDIFLKYNALPYHGEAEDIAYTVLFLASDESKFMTGQTLVVDGGYTITNPAVADFNKLMAQKQQ